jgi:dolichol kinase
MNQISLKSELCRKGLHLLLILVPIAYCQVGKWPSVAIFAAIATIFVTLDYTRRSNPKVKEIFAKIFGFVLRLHELNGEKLCGASWVALAAFINFAVFSPEIAVTAFSILAISDAVAAIIGRNFPSQPFFEKSLNGSAAFFISGFIVLITCGLIFHSRIWFYLFGVFALAAVAIMESRPSLLKIDDNFLIPIAFSIIMTTFDIMWNYSY